MTHPRFHLPLLHRTARAFSLLEVLIASAILALLVALLLGMIDGTSRVWRDAEQRREASREMRAGLRMMAEDLHSAVLTKNPETLFFDHEKRRDGESQRLFFLVSHPHDDRHDGIKGDLCATGYFIAPDPEGKGARNLYRFHASGDEVAESFERNRLASLYATALVVSTNTELLARNVTGLEVHPVTVSGEGSHPDALRLTLSAVNGDTARLIASNPEATERNKLLLHQRQHRLSTLVSLPPRRDPPLGP